MNKNNLNIDTIIDNIGELIILNSGLNIFAETNTYLNKNEKEQLISINESISLKLNEIQNTLMQIEDFKKEIFDVLELYINNEIYLLPMNNIKRVIHPQKENIKGDYNDLILEGSLIYKIFDLEYFFFNKTNTELENSILIIIKNNIALKVNKTGKTKQVVSKSLEKNFIPTKYFSGIAINGFGKIELILDTNKLESEYIKKN